jgi:predicted RNA polymerase sigma factor
MQENPSAWLMATAKNGAPDVLRRERTARTFAPELGRFLEREWTLPLVNASSEDQDRADYQSSSSRRNDQRLCRFEVGSFETFGEPVVDPRE